jgi:hypothetical protein
VSILLNRPGINPERPGGFGFDEFPTSSGFSQEGNGIPSYYTSTQHWGESAAGAWRLSVADHASGEIGTLESWRVRVFGERVSADDNYVFTDVFNEMYDWQNPLEFRDLDGGVDTINASAISARGIEISLRPGSLSDFGGGYMRLARDGSIIENAFAGDGDDIIDGNSTSNRLHGGRGADLLRGEDGDDFLFGGPANDTLEGGSGFDTLTGGSGADTFRFMSTAESYTGYFTSDHITDFEEGVDTIYLGAIDANPTVAGSQRFAFYGEISPKSNRNSDGSLFRDENGNTRTDDYVLYSLVWWHSEFEGEPFTNIVGARDISNDVGWDDLAITLVGHYAVGAHFFSFEGAGIL